MQQRLYTTGEISHLCKVAPRTVSKWIDQGNLEGYRIPGSQHRRVTEASLIRFARERGIPLFDRESGPRKILTYGISQDITKSLKTLLIPSEFWSIFSAESLFESGHYLAENRPHMIIVDLAIGKIEAMHISSFIKKIFGNSHSENRPVLLALSFMDQGFAESVGFKNWLSPDNGMNDLYYMIRRLFDEKESRRAS